MKRNTLRNISLIVLAACILVFVLFKSSASINDKMNGFTRSKYSLSPGLKYQVNLDETISDLVGMEGDHVYFLGSTHGNLYSWDFSDGASPNGAISLKKIQLPEYCYVKRNGQRLYIFRYNDHSVEILNLNNGATKSLQMGNIYSSPTIIDSNNIAFRVAEPDRKNRIFSKLNTTTNDITVEKDLSLKLNDGGLITDGILNYDATTKQLVYTYYFRNGYLCFDTSLRLLSRNETIDTFTTFQVEIKRMKNIVTHLNPPKAVCAYSCVDNGFLYIKSKLRADNESDEDFFDNDIIDVYDLKKYRYAGSLYLPKVSGQRMNRFLIKSDLLAVCYEKKVQLFRIN